MEKSVKYPRTMHLPWSPGATRDDRFLLDTSCFDGQYVVVTEKMDGENTTMTNQVIHARSLTPCDHPSRSWVKQLHGQVKYDIPDGFRVCGENLYAQHSIGYENLLSYFMVFNIWDENNVCLSWEDTLEYCELLGLTHVKVLWSGVFDRKSIEQACWSDAEKENSEGYVVRIAKSFKYEDFSQAVAKYVRENHVQTDTHWMHAEIVKNTLKKR